MTLVFKAAESERLKVSKEAQLEDEDLRIPELTNRENGDKDTPDMKVEGER